MVRGPFPSPLYGGRFEESDEDFEALMAEDDREDEAPAPEPDPEKRFEFGICPERPALRGERKGYDAIEVRLVDAPQKLLGWVTGLVAPSRFERGAKVYPFANNPEHPDWTNEFGSPPQLMLQTEVLSVKVSELRDAGIAMPAYGSIMAGGTVAQWRYLAVSLDQFEWLFDRDTFVPADEKKLRHVLPPARR